MDVDTSRLPSPPPPPYPAQIEYLRGSRDIRLPFPSISVAIRSAGLSPSDEPFRNVSSTSKSPTGSTVVTYHPHLSPRFPGRRRDRSIANRILALGMLPITSGIMSRRRRGNFKSEAWEPLEKSTIFALPKSAQARRYYSRTFPADASTQPHLEECYPQPYGVISSPHSPPLVCHENPQSTKDLDLELERLEKTLHTLHSEIEAVTVQHDLLVPLLPRPRVDNNLTLSVDSSVWGRRQETIYKRMQSLKSQRLNMLKDVETTERDLKPIYEELTRRIEARERFRRPIKIIAAEMTERNLGRKWLRGETNWAHAPDINMLCSSCQYPKPRYPTNPKTTPHIIRQPIYRTHLVLSTLLRVSSHLPVYTHL
ncbi:hypothetical protein EYC80_002535 [Monilinia laxa]|uniref:Uncharacterized protein n=1 Tax=Monilinia laxa TaxID=61186 RepID=A0A5N6K4W6_MONLA|nr:hypothetical protein EYC80_002535 [Monilinia laxa]